MGQKHYAVFDIETTGLDPHRDHIIELGWMIVDSDGPGTVQSHVVNPGRVQVPAASTAINGITQEMVDGARSTKDILTQFALETGDLPLVGHNVIRFDAPFLQAAVRRHLDTMKPAAFSNSRFVDTAALYKGWRLGTKPMAGEGHAEYAQRVLNIRARGLRYSLEWCCQDLGVSVDDIELHRASGDVVATQRAFGRLLELGAIIPGLT